MFVKQKALQKYKKSDYDNALEKKRQ